MHTRDKAAVEVAHIFHQYGREYRRSHPLPVNRLRAMRAIEACRTADLGGHVDECGHCGTKLISYNSCRNRHCPKCQFLKKERWIEDRGKDLLPIPYFHVVFTIPDLLNPLVLRNQEVLYAILFKAVSETLMELSADRKRLGAEIGFIGILHTWGQNMMEHPHIHNVVTGGGLSREGRNWKSCKKSFFLPVKVMSRLFRGKFISYLKKLRTQDKLVYPGAINHLAQPAAWGALIADLYRKKWVVYSKPPFDGSKGVLDYLGRYTHRIAISNHRIVKLEDDKVSFRWRDYADNNKTKIMTVAASEFIRRFLLHVLPDRFVKIRHYGLLGNRCRKQKLDRCRKLLACVDQTKEERKTETWQDALLRLTGFDVSKCPACGERAMRTVETIRPARCKGPPRI
ncbi:MAG TPA: IS91 family transposase [Nitrospirota bacterium]|nr:IS91 family transposase [Nitrospirota bacterium]